MSKIPRDIEQLLTWAFVEELTNRELSSAEWNWKNMRDQCERGGVSIDEGSAPQRYSVVSPPHPDAMTIERQAKDVAKLLGQDSSKSVPVDYLASRSMLFGDMDRSSLPRSMSLPRFNLIATIMSMAVLKQRPRWNVGRIRIGRTLASNGKVQVEGAKRNGAYPDEAYCPLTWSPGLKEIAEARAEYLLWHQALTVLADSLTDSLRDFTPLRPSAPQTPWIAAARPPVGRQPQLLVTPQVIAAIHEARKRRPGRRV